MKALIITCSLIISLGTVGQTKKKMNSIRIHNLSKLIVKADVNGKRGFFLIDTGSSISLLNSTELKRYKLEENPFEHRQAIGFNGSKIIINKVSNSDIVLGEGFRHNDFYSMNLNKIAEAILAETGIKVIGIIGADLLIKYNGIIDYNQRYLTLAGKSSRNGTAISMLK